MALVSEATAAALWPGLDPLGQTLDLAAVPEGRADRRLPRGRVSVIGVTEDVTNGSIFDGLDASCVYFPTDARARRTCRCWSGPASMTSRYCDRQ